MKIELKSVKRLNENVYKVMYECETRNRYERERIIKKFDSVGDYSIIRINENIIFYCFVEDLRLNEQIEDRLKDIKRDLICWAVS